MTKLEFAIIIVVIFSFLAFFIYSIYKAATKTHHTDSLPFQKDDKVTAFGNIGEVKGITENGMFVIVKFPEFDSTVVFNIDGKFTKWNKNVSLRKI